MIGGCKQYIFLLIGEYNLGFGIKKIKLRNINWGK